MWLLILKWCIHIFHKAPCKVWKSKKSQILEIWIGVRSSPWYVNQNNKWLKLYQFRYFLNFFSQFKFVYFKSYFAIFWAIQDEKSRSFPNDFVVSPYTSSTTTFVKMIVCTSKDCDIFTIYQGSWILGVQVGDQIRNLMQCSKSANGKVISVRS